MRRTRAESSIYHKLSKAKRNNEVGVTHSFFYLSLRSLPPSSHKMLRVDFSSDSSETMFLVWELALNSFYMFCFLLLFGWIKTLNILLVWVQFSHLGTLVRLSWESQVFECYTSLSLTTAITRRDSCQLHCFRKLYMNLNNVLLHSTHLMAFTRWDK